MAGAKEKHASIDAFSEDAGYRGTAVLFANETLNMTLHLSERINDAWAIMPKRWVVERTFAWLNNFRRLAKDFEILTATSENMIRIAMIKLTLACVFNILPDSFLEMTLGKKQVLLARKIRSVEEFLQLFPQRFGNIDLGGRRY
jgi:hypothetical protein